MLARGQGNKLATTLPRVSTVSPVSPLAVPKGVTLIRSIILKGLCLWLRLNTVHAFQQTEIFLLSCFISFLQVCHSSSRSSHSPASRTHHVQRALALAGPLQPMRVAWISVIFMCPQPLHRRVEMQSSQGERAGPTLAAGATSNTTTMPHDPPSRSGGSGASRRKKPPPTPPSPSPTIPQPQHPLTKTQQQPQQQQHQSPPLPAASSAVAAAVEDTNDMLYKALMHHKRMEQQRVSSLMSNTRTISEAILRKQMEAQQAKLVVSATAQYATNAKSAGDGLQHRVVHSGMILIFTVRASFTHIKNTHACNDVTQHARLTTTPELDRTSATRLLPLRL